MKNHFKKYLLQDEIQDTLFMNDLKFKFVSNWERGREEQNTERLSISEKTLEDQIRDLKDNKDMELRCHIEIEAYIKQAIAVSNYTDL
jgi:cell division protein FtsB